jgi:hypothetical protein
MTLMMIGKDKQSFITPKLQKVYSNKEYKVLKSHFVGHEYLIIDRRTKKVAFTPSYTELDLTKLEFDYKILMKF